MKFSPRFEIISSPDKSPDRPAFFNIRNSNPNMNNYRVIQFGRHSIHFRFAGIGRRKNRSISPDSWQLTAMNGTLINRQRGWAMYPWLDCFDSNHSDTFPGRTNFLLPTSCPPARRRIPIAHWSPHPPSLPLFQLFTRVEIRRRGRAFRFESWQTFCQRALDDFSFDPREYHLQNDPPFPSLKSFKTSPRIGFTCE